MVVDNWTFIQDFKRGANVTCWRVIVDGELYEEIWFPDEEEYTSLIDTCVALVESTEKLAGRIVNSTTINPADSILSLYTKQYTPGA